MKILVIGSGLIGVSTAYFLRRRGHDVTVLDRQEGPGRETSFANAGLLTPSMSDPWNAPGSWRVLLASLFRSDSPLQLRLRALPSLTRWGLEFLANSRAAVFERNTLDNLRLAMYSLEVMHRLQQEVRIEYGGNNRGSLRLFRDRAALDHAAAVAQAAPHGLAFRKLSVDDTVALEPGLEPIAGQVAGGIHSPVDESGDAHRFTVALAEEARRLGVEFRFRTDVSAFEVRSGAIVAAIAGQERLLADRFVVAAGSYTPLLLRSIGVRVPVRPAKGYSVTFPHSAAEPLLRVPVIDDALHAVVVPLEHGLRVAGTAEFAGYDLSLPQARVQNLLDLVARLLPRASLDPSSATPWCGLRSMSANGVPIIGATSLPNLSINTGHGHLGWTMAAGSGQLLADLLCGTAPALDPTPYALASR